MENFEKVLVQYEPMISALIRKLHIYRDYDGFRQVGKIALWQAWRKFDEEKGNFTPFAYRSMQGAMLDELKRESRLAERMLIAENEQFERLEDPLPVAEEMPEWLEAAPLTLNERLLLDELFLNGKSVVELAEAHNISLAGMKKRRERTLKKVKAYMEETDDCFRPAENGTKDHW
ncbi:sigma-70 family RNA polymerase sigma factor [Planococcus salinus]|uniref:Sigma-70 family RNA polymerase sigma factor n=1 Tax=Planococcus salinus TaxID=1848460 RepID=A0A3M8P731_9BACL|nr:sigma-70 family RNA polymerase sigma factor [Planococcus salinus]RNF39473.1 sigma-70 family RNA polymerase sigma factor [Planococcus salinus]